MVCLPPPDRPPQETEDSQEVKYLPILFTTLSPIPGTVPEIGWALGKYIRRKAGRRGEPLAPAPTYKMSPHETAPAASTGIFPPPFLGTWVSMPGQGTFLSPQAHLDVSLPFQACSETKGSSPLPAPTVAPCHHPGHPEGCVLLIPTLQVRKLSSRSNWPKSAGLLFRWDQNFLMVFQCSGAVIGVKTTVASHLNSD